MVSTEPNGSLDSMPGSIEWLFWELGSPVEDRNITYGLIASSGANGTFYFNGTVYYGENEESQVMGDSEILAISCYLIGDYPPCGEVSLDEIIDFITLWSKSEASLNDVVNLITAWSG